MNMKFVLVILIFAVIAGLIVGAIDLAVKKGISSLKIMLLGINITLFGGILVVDPGSSLDGIEYLIALFGLIISFIGLGKKD